MTVFEKYKIDNYTINEDGSIDVDGDVFLYGIGLTELPINFNKVSGTFDCSNNKLTTLKRCPKYVGDDFSCGTNYLTDLKYSPKLIHGSFYCSGNNLKSYVSDSIVGVNFYCQFIDNDFCVTKYNEWNLNEKRKLKLSKIRNNNF
tara:strand:+ start:6307 stop:6741 length:435 start_codon:yes stop_codon:yes gene_type:complete